MTDHDQRQLPLPGLEEPPVNITPMIRALHRTIAWLESSGLITEEHAFELESMRTLARSAEQKLATGRMSTLSQDIEQALKIKAGIVGEDTDASVDEQLRAAMDDFNRRLDQGASP